MNIVVVGSANQDLLIQVDRFPVPGETLVGSDYRLAAGGKGANQAVAAARLGGRVSLLARVGADAFGGSMLDGWLAEGIDTTWIQRDESSPSGVAFILIGPEAENEIVVSPGANRRLTPADVAAAEPAIAGAAILVGQIEVPLAAVARAIELAKAHRVTVVLNPAPACDLSDSLLQLVDVLTPNETEAGRLVGRAVSTVDDAYAAGQDLLDRGVGNVVITMGRRGAVVVEPHQRQHLTAVPVDAVDPTGAGDTFNGALAVFLSEGCPLAEAARLANVAAALSTTRVGAQTAMPTRQEVLGWRTPLG